MRNAVLCMGLCLLATTAGAEGPYIKLDNLPMKLQVGEDASYRLRVRNDNDAPLEVELHEILPRESLMVTDVRSNKGEIRKEALEVNDPRYPVAVAVCDFGILEPGEEAVCGISVYFPAATTVRLTTVLVDKATQRPLASLRKVRVITPGMPSYWFGKEHRAGSTGTQERMRFN